MYRKLGFLLVLLLLVSCNTEQPSTIPTLAPAASTTEALTPIFGPTSINELPTLYPTYTPPATAVPISTKPARPVATAAPTIPANEIGIQFNYRIPALNLNYYLESTVSGQMSLTNINSEETVHLTNQSSVLFNLQERLAQFPPTPLTEECFNCVLIQYKLPLTNEEGEGHWTDPNALIFFERYFAHHIAPAFPPNTLIGMRQEVSSFDVAHSFALTSDGTLWMWNGLDNKIPNPTPFIIPTELQTEIDKLALETIDDRYEINCPVLPRETIFIQNQPENKLITILCPTFSLPQTLLPVYIQLNQIHDQIRPDLIDEKPAEPFPLDLILYYARNETELLLNFSGELLIRQPNKEETIGEISQTKLNDLGQKLLGTQSLTPGIDLFIENDASHLIMWRGYSQFYTIAWNSADDLSDPLYAVVEQLDLLIDQYQSPTNTAITPAPEATGTP